VLNGTDRSHFWLPREILRNTRVTLGGRLQGCGCCGIWLPARARNSSSSHEQAMALVLSRRLQQFGPLLSIAVWAVRPDCPARPIPSCVHTKTAKDLGISRSKVQAEGLAPGAKAAGLGLMKQVEVARLPAEKQVQAVQDITPCRRAGGARPLTWADAKARLKESQDKLPNGIGGHDNVTVTMRNARNRFLRRAIRDARAKDPIVPLPSCRNTLSGSSIANSLALIWPNSAIKSREKPPCQTRCIAA
jgi:hypothetical protein